jgi:glycerol-3-phosphate O-acyltransferase/dihydroxyacetone phosphate acyltransferase
MIWQILRFWVSFILPPFYKRLQIKNPHFARIKGPVIIAMNHPNSFVDPILFAVLTHPLRPSFLARGDAFKPGIASWFLGKIGIIPIFRIQDGGKEGLKKNTDTYQLVNARLANNEKVIIFAEGLCVMERRLRPLKKGVPRMVFGAYESLGNDSLQVVPVGVNYSQADKFRSDVFIQVGEPIPVRDYWEDYQKQPARTQNRFLQDLEPRMKTLITHVEDPLNDKAVVWLETLKKQSLLRERNLNRQSLEDDFLILKELTSLLNAAQRENNPALVAFREKAGLYFEKLEKVGLRDWCLDESRKAESSRFAFLQRLIYFIAGLPFFIPGLLINYLPFRLTHLLTWKLIREKEFYVSIGTGVAMVLYLIWYLLLGLLLQAFLPVRVWTPGILLFFLLCGAFSVRFYSLPKKIMGQWRMFRNASLTKDLKTERDVLLQLINKF